MIKKPLYIALCLALFISVEVIAYPSSVQNSFDQQDTFDFDNTIDIEEYIDAGQPIAHRGPPHRHRRRCYLVTVPGPPVWGPWGWRRPTVRKCRPVIVYKAPPPPRRRPGYRPGHPRGFDYRPHHHPRPRRPRYSQRSRHSSPSHNFEGARDHPSDHHHPRRSRRSSSSSHNFEGTRDRHLPVEDLEGRYLSPSARSPENEEDRLVPLPSRSLAGVDDRLVPLPSRSSEDVDDRPPPLSSRNSTEDTENVYIYTYCDHRRNLRDIRREDEQDDLVKNLLFNAICDNESTIVGFLLEDRGYFINEVVFTGETPLILAIKLENMDIVRLLVESFEADICREIQGLTAIGWAEELRNEGIFEYLEERSSQCF